MPRFFLPIIFVAFTSHLSAAHIQPIIEMLPHVKGHILVKVNKTTDPKKVLVPLLQSLSALKVKDFPLVDGLNLYRFDENIDVHEVAKKFLALDTVEYAEPDYIYSIGHSSKKLSSIDDPEFIRQWALENNGKNGDIEDADINAESMWAKEVGKKGIVIGVIDTGIDYQHNDLQENMWKNLSEIPNNGKDDDNNGYIDDVHGINAIKKDGNPMDDHLHGTHVAGIIGAQANNQLGVSGVVQVVELAACKFLSAVGLGSISDAITCMDYFASLKSRKDNPVNIVATNNSWGGGAYSQAMFDAISAHEKLGILFVAAAGNQAINNDENEVFPANYQRRNVISVAATDSADALATFSNFGQKKVHIAAPGHRILSTLPGNKYGELSGTSMAAPHVSGVIAAIASHFLGIESFAIKNLVMAGGKPTDATHDTTIAARRLRGADVMGIGSLTCLNQIVTSREEPQLATISITLGESLFLSAQHISCASSAGSLTVWQGANDEKIILNDDGVDGDVVANDGIASRLWTPSIKGIYELKFSESDVVNVSVIDAKK